jgi:hypothetical protein
MIDISDLRTSLEGTSSRSLASVPDSELLTFAAVNGSFTDADWKKMPALFTVLGNRPCNCQTCRKGKLPPLPPRKTYFCSSCSGTADKSWEACHKAGCPAMEMVLTLD